MMKSFLRVTLLLFASVPFAVLCSGKPSMSQMKGMKGKKGKTVPKQKSGDDATCSMGLVQVESTRSFNDTYSLLITTLQNDKNVFIAKEFDAVMVAGMAGVMGLPPNRVVIFGNPALATPLIQADQTSALDFPQKMQVYQTTEGKVFVGYNTPKYIEQRYDSITASSNRILRTIRQTMRFLAANVAGVDPSTIDDNVMSSGKNLFHKKSRSDVFVQPSNADFATTYSRIIEAIGLRKNELILVETVDHQAAAAAVGLPLKPTMLIMVCRPAFDAGFMQVNQCAVADFPLKILVTQNKAGVVEVRINDFHYLRQRHHIASGSIDESVFNGVQETLVRIIAQATA